MFKQNRRDFFDAGEGEGKPLVDLFGLSPVLNRFLMASLAYASSYLALQVLYLLLPALCRLTLLTLQSTNLSPNLPGAQRTLYWACCPQI